MILQKSDNNLQELNLLLHFQIPNRITNKRQQQFIHTDCDGEDREKGEEKIGKEGQTVSNFVC